MTPLVFPSLLAPGTADGGEACFYLGPTENLGLFQACHQPPGLPEQSLPWAAAPAQSFLSVWCLLFPCPVPGLSKGRLTVAGGCSKQGLQKDWENTVE